MPENPKPPQHLTPKTRRWYAEITAEYDLEPQHLLLLQAAAESWDRAQQAREQIAREGLTFVDRHKAIKPHPAAAIERDNKALFARLLRELALDVSEPAENRPPGIVGKAGLKVAE